MFFLLKTRFERIVLQGRIHWCPVPAWTATSC